MAEPTVYFTYVTATWAVAGLHLTQAAANAEAAADATLTALVGGLATVRNSAGDDVPAVLAEPNGIWSVYADAPKVRQAIPNPYPLRTAFRAWHERLVYLGGLLQQDRVHATYPPADIQFAQGLLFGLHQGAYYQHHTSPLTTTQKLLWLQASALGPNDMAGGEQVYDRDDPETFFEIAAGLPAASKVVPGALSVVNPLPAGDGVTFARRTLAQMLVRVGENDQQPSVALLDRGRWIDQVNA